MSRRAAEAQEVLLFSGISVTDREEISSVACEKAFLAGETIFIEDDPVRQISMLTSGHVKMTQLSRNGLEVILRVCGPGEVIGGFSEHQTAWHCSSARAIQSATVLVWEADVFEALMLRFPTLRHNVMQTICDRLSKMEQRFREISTEKVAVRLSKEIARLLKQVGKSIDGGFEIRLSREELAQLTGTTVFTVSRLLSMWERRGIVRTQTQNRSVQVSNFQNLEKLAE
jgi:CRP/FNR family transcriptional regulator, nitrogen oxide reductase regulator